jgi:carbon storage regulator
MLVLTRKLNQNIIIDGRIVVRYLQRDGNSVRIGISAPPDVPVHRQEIYEEIRRTNLSAMTTRRSAMRRTSLAVN